LHKYLEFLILAITGICIGSFLGVCIFRIPSPKSSLWTRSHCPGCNQRIRWRDLVPVISYIFLKGRCKWCGNKISWQYPFVEVFTTILIILLFLKFGYTWDFVFYSSISALLIVIAFIDFNNYIIFNRTIVLGLVIVFVAVVLNDSKNVNVLAALYGGLLGGGIIWLVGWFGKIVFKRESMGGGDIKLGVLIGFALGAEGLIVTFLMAVLFGAVVGCTGIILRKMTLKQKLPFGFFLSLGSVIYILWGNSVSEFFKMVYGF